MLRSITKFFDFLLEVEVVNVCQAVEDMMKTRERKGEEVGRKQGRMDMLVQLVRKGRFNIADAAEEAGLSCEAFARKMESEKS